MEGVEQEEEQVAIPADVKSRIQETQAACVNLPFFSFSSSKRSSALRNTARRRADETKLLNETDLIPQQPLRRPQEAQAYRRNRYPGGRQDFHPDCHRSLPPHHQASWRLCCCSRQGRRDSRYRRVRFFSFFSRARRSRTHLSRIAVSTRTSSSSPVPPARTSPS
jgi:hypothetical protein